MGDIVHASAIPFASGATSSQLPPDPAALTLTSDTTFEVIHVHSTASSTEPPQYTIKVIPESVPTYTIPEQQLVLTKQVMNGTIVKHRHDTSGTLFKVVGRKVVVRPQQALRPQSVSQANMSLYESIKMSQATAQNAAVAVFTVEDDFGSKRDIDALDIVEASAEEAKRWFGM